MRILEFTIDAASDGVTVERWLRRRGFSRHLLILLKQAQGGLTANGAPIRSVDHLHTGDRLRLALPETERTDSVTPVFLPLDIRYSDEDLLVLNKPAGMAVHPSQGNRTNTVANALAAHNAAHGLPFVFRPIGRLDKNTSGLLTIANNAFSACLLAGRPPERTYLAVCEGMAPPCGMIDAPIGRLLGSTIARTVCPDGQPARTAFTRLWTTPDGARSLVRVRLFTGRTHQIRVHFAHIGHPLTGDFLYGTPLSGFTRHALHASRLTLTHPISGAALSLSTPLPDDLQALLPGLPPALAND